MGRIRTIKPEFFRHELLQDLERSHPKLKPMLVFAGLWTCCDKNGRFEWKPRSLKLDLLPFLAFNINETLQLLIDNGLIQRYETAGKEYGSIPTFHDHQRITGKEFAAPGKYPDPSQEIPNGTPRETSEKSPGAQEGKGIEGRERSIPQVFPWETNSDDTIPEGLNVIQYALHCCEAVGAAKTNGNRGAFERAIEALAAEEDLTLAGATKLVIERARDRPPTKGSWIFWVNDGGWKSREAFHLDINE